MKSQTGDIVISFGHRCAGAWLNNGTHLIPIKDRISDIEKLKYWLKEKNIENNENLYILKDSEEIFFFKLRWL